MNAAPGLSPPPPAPVRRRRPAVLAYVGLLSVLALLSLTLLPSLSDLEGRAAHVVALTVAATFAGAAHVRLPRLRTKISPVDPLIYCALAVGGPVAGLLVSVASAAGATVRRTNAVDPVRLAFNLANATVSAVGAGVVFSASGGTAGTATPGALVLPLLAAAAAYFAANSIVVTAVLTLDRRGGPVIRTWRRTFLWTLPATLISAPVGVVLYVIARTDLLWSMLPALAACGLLTFFFRGHRQSSRTDGASAER